MSKKNKETGKVEVEEQKYKELQVAYDEYVFRMKGRIEKNEKVEIKPYEKWIRKVKKSDEHGNEVEAEVVGDTGETKNEKFRRLAVKRMKKALMVLNTIINLSSNQYESSVEEQTKIINALRLKVLDIENAFQVSEKQASLFDFESEKEKQEI